MRRFSLVSIAFFILLIIGATKIIVNGKSNSNSQLKIVCTTTLIADVVKHIVDNKLEVVSLMGPGIDPHTYKAKSHDSEILSSADLILYNGLHLEGKMEEVFAQLTAQGKAYAVSQGIERDLLRSVGFENVFDPHIWFDVPLWIQVVDFCVEKCIQLDPPNRDIYLENACNYVKRLKSLDQYIQQEILKIPLEKRVIITAHDAFGYFGNRYGCKVIGLQGLSTDSDISLQDIMQLVHFIVQHKVPVIFAETAITNQGLEAVKRACSARGWQLRIIDQLYTDALGLPNSQADTYEGMMYANVQVITHALVS